ncbi:hypothetical protein WN48_10113 [Eufriesea mexicana]|nr:hypothetical protein WN48_10113 [Eufriesea mexicana]
MQPVLGYCVTPWYLVPVSSFWYSSIERLARCSVDNVDNRPEQFVEFMAQQGSGKREQGNDKTNSRESSRSERSISKKKKKKTKREEIVNTLNATLVSRTDTRLSVRVRSVLRDRPRPGQKGANFGLPSLDLRLRMSSKRKSPPTKLSEGGGGTGTVAGANEEEEDTTSSVTGGPGGEVAVGEEGPTTPVDIEECYPHQRGGDCESSGCSSPATTSEPDLRDSPSPSSNSLRTSKRQRVVLLTCKMNSESLSLQDDTSNNRRNSPPPTSTPTGHNAHWELEKILRYSKSMEGNLDVSNVGCHWFRILILLLDYFWTKEIAIEKDDDGVSVRNQTNQALEWMSDRGGAVDQRNLAGMSLWVADRRRGFHRRN